MKKTIYIALAATFESFYKLECFTDKAEALATAARYAKQYEAGQIFEREIQEPIINYIFRVNAEGFHFSSQAFTFEELVEIKNFALKLREARLSEGNKSV